MAGTKCLRSMVWNGGAACGAVEGVSKGLVLVDMGEWLIELIESMELISVCLSSQFLPVIATLWTYSNHIMLSYIRYLEGIAK